MVSEAFLDSSGRFSDSLHYMEVSSQSVRARELGEVLRFLGADVSTTQVLEALGDLRLRLGITTTGGMADAVKENRRRQNE
jgi:hypothetical protein